MAGGDSAFDGPLAAATIAASEVSENGIVLFAPRVDSADDAGGDDNPGEASTTEPVFGTLGSGGRPLAPNDAGAAEAICARSSDGLPVIAARDLRIESARADPPAEGTIYKAGYYGAELRFDVVSGQEKSTATLRDTSGEQLAVDETGVRQGEDAAAKDVALAQPAIDLLAEMGPIVLLLAAAVNTLAPGTITPTQISNLTTKLAPYLAPGSPNAPTTRAPKLRGEPGT